LISDGTSFYAGAVTPTDTHAEWVFTEAIQPIGFWGQENSKKILQIGVINFDTFCDPVQLPPEPIV